MREFNGASLSSQFNSFFLIEYRVFLRGGGRGQIIGLSSSRSEKQAKLASFYFIFIFSRVFTAVCKAQWKTSKQALEIIIIKKYFSQESHYSSLKLFTVTKCAWTQWEAKFFFTKAYPSV